MGSNKPLYKAISYQYVFQFSRTLHQYDNAVFFHSAKYHEKLGRYSFIAIEPFNVWVLEENQNGNPFHFLSNQLKSFSLETISHLPPFQGGLAGYISYDMARDIECLPTIAKREFAYPQLVLGYYDTVIAMDHFQQKAWIISTGFPEKISKKRLARAANRLHALEKKIEQTQSMVFSNTLPMMMDVNIQSNFTKESYQQAVEQVKNYILNGDVFEVNLSQRFRCQLPRDFNAFHLFEKIAKRNPAQFSAYMRFGNLSIVLTSPERFLQENRGLVETRPIKGTKTRSKEPAEDAKMDAIL